MLRLAPGRILIAFSGGPDSLGLAALLRDRDVVLGYVDHRLRGARASRQERRAVRAAAAALGLPLARCRVSPTSGSEAAARRARYAALHRLARKHRCASLALAHSADDRAETVLFNLLRGTGLRGLAAPLPSVEVDGVRRVRPALGMRRDALRRAAAGLAPVVDRGNRSTRFARSRIRTLHLPALRRLLGTDPVPWLCRLADAAAGLRAELSRRAERLAASACRDRLLAESAGTFPYLVEALRQPGPPLTANAYAALRTFLRAGRTGRAHVAPGGETWTLRAGGAVDVRPRITR